MDKNKTLKKEKSIVVLEQEAEGSGDIKIMEIAAGKFIVGHYEMGLAEFEKAWTGQYAWMNEKGYEKADREPFEIYYNDFNQNPEKKCIVDICIPIV
ncbi:MAG: GyrI-like domain-containing protein [Vicingaceae bacterium]